MSGPIKPMTGGELAFGLLLCFGSVVPLFAAAWWLGVQ